MQRLFGTSKGNVPPPNLTDASANIDNRVGSIDKKIEMQNQELAKYQQQMKNMKEGPTKNALKQKALRVLRERKILESRRENLFSQSFNMGEANYALQSVKDTQTTVAAMKIGVKQFKKETKKLDIGAIEDLQDEVSDMVAMNDEFGEILGRSVAPVDFSEADLDAELAALGEDFDMNRDNAYLDEAINAPGVPSTAIGGTSVISNPPGASSGGVQLDEFGLPRIPQH